MITLDGRQIDDYGNVIIEDEHIFNMMYRGYMDFSKIIGKHSSKTQTYNKYCKMFDHEDKCINEYRPPTIDITYHDKMHQHQWNIPEQYLIMNVDDFLLRKCTSNEEIQRVKDELFLYKKHNMIPVLKAMIYIVDVMREHNIVWGVGRGSSVASYILYLIGLHKVNSIQYKLDISEFLK